ncbi:protein kinase domain-containing protein [Magnetococcales bacterium HHB-1]
MVAQYRNALKPNQKIAGYTIQRVLGRGGFAFVYLAEEAHLKQPVVIKEYFPKKEVVREGDHVFAESLSEERSFKNGLKHFLKEARLQASFNHPQFVRAHTLLKKNNTAYLVMDFEPGETLKGLSFYEKASLKKGYLPQILPTILDALAFLHHKKVLHRDLKPGNILLRKKDGSPILLDFGAARRLKDGQSGAIVYTTNYTPPEQYDRHGRQGPWTDIYALAATLYRLISGEKLPSSLERKSADKDPLPPLETVSKERLPETFLQAIDQALQLKIEKRPQTIQQWREPLLEGWFKEALKKPDIYLLSQNMRQKRLCFVSATGAGDFSSVGEAIAQTASGGRIILLPGTYKELVVIEKTLEIIGQGEKESILLTFAEDNVLEIRTEHAYIEGITIQGLSDKKAEQRYYAVNVLFGRPIFESCIISNRSLAAVGVHGSMSHPQFRRCHLKACATNAFFFYDFAGGHVEHCLIEGCGRAGVTIKTDADPFFDHCTIRDSKQAGAFVYYGGLGRFNHCRLIGNRFGIEVDTQGAPQIIHSHITQSKRIGVLVYDQGETLLRESKVDQSGLSGVQVRTKGMVTLECSKVSKNRQSGVYIHREGYIKIIGGEIRDNLYAGVKCEKKGRADVRYATIRRNGYEGLWAIRQGEIEARHCDLRGNQEGAWAMDEQSVFTSEDIREQ